MARGNERKAIFRDDQDRRCFLATLAEMVERSVGIRLHAYVLMANHHHLLLETPLPKLSGVGWLQASDTVRCAVGEGRGSALDVARAYGYPAYGRICHVSRANPMDAECGPGLMASEP